MGDLKFLSKLEISQHSTAKNKLTRPILGKKTKIERKHGRTEGISIRKETTKTQIENS
jgi:hypothetical protein